MDELMNILDVNSIISLVGIVAFFAIGIVLCFKGFKAFKLALALLFLVIGAYSGLRLYEFLTPYIITDRPDTIMMIFVIVLGLIFASMSYWLYDKALVMLVTFAGCYLFYNGYIYILVNPSGMSKSKALIIGLIFGLICGIAVHFLQRLAIKIFTSAVGAYFIASGITPYLLSIEKLNEICSKIYDNVFDNFDIKGPEALLILVFTIILGLIGFSAQAKDK